MGRNTSTVVAAKEPMCSPSSVIIQKLELSGEHKQERKGKGKGKLHRKKDA